jgi:hypothetical protein
MSSGETKPSAPHYFKHITFEVAPISSAVPDPVALENFRERLHENRICNRNNIEFRIRPLVELTGFPGVWTGGIIRAYEIQRRTLIDLDPDDKDLVVFIAYIDGAFSQRGRVRNLGGIQYSSTAFAIFKHGACDREDSVLLHEFGHLLGMLKNKKHENYDKKHPSHCVDKRCVMFWSAPKGNANFCKPCRNELHRLFKNREPR